MERLYGICLRTKTDNLKIYIVAVEANVAVAAVADVEAAAAVVAVANAEVAAVADVEAAVDDW
ncbi:12913_t:CDS:2 [Ambispora gerdemannii]|uniref:12913_t:CDS:1 n=1 Tax=Ambispora gerdemannii TaxID=144530 RepID=A0A9N9B3C1_9GLOM|nr:12913_t:CDS:2 [Ambispora gerdemannii]